MDDSIDIGIDLGTTNSVVATNRYGGIEIIKNRNAEITPSLVSYDSRGTEKVGQTAKALFSDPQRGPDVQAEFKRSMGQDVKLRFEAAGIEKSPEQLSAAVLAELRRAAQERTGGTCEAAVITVPAMFELPQTEATARAARLAGFVHSELLQEPVAAAVAYGMRSASQRAIWLVYDFGGGTFDTSLVAVRDGELRVVKHGGNNHLGGADFDWAIVDGLLLPEISGRYDLGSFQRFGRSHRPSVGRRNRLKALAEEIKVELSRSAAFELFRDAGELFADDKGIQIELELRLTRERFEDLIRVRVEESVSIAREVVKSSGYALGDIERVVLVGGSTFVPLVREHVGRLGIPLASEIDPMTVVAHGAAAYAASRSYRSAASATRPNANGSPDGTVSLELLYAKVTKSALVPVDGRFRFAPGASVDGHTVEIVRSDQGFTTGRVPLTSSGIFGIDVQTRDSGSSSFEVLLRDASGRVVSIEPRQFAITSGLSVGKATLPSGCQLALVDGRARMLIKGGTPLPAEAHCDVRTVQELKAGSNGRLVIPFLSGDHEQASHNLVGTSLIILGTDIKRDLPVDSLVEVALRIDASGAPSATVYIERLDQEFSAPGWSTELQSAEAMRARLETLGEQLSSLRADATASGHAPSLAAVMEFGASTGFDATARSIDAWARGDEVAGGQARNELVTLSKQLDELEAIVWWPAREVEFEELAKSALQTVADSADTEARKAMDHAVAEGHAAIRSRDKRMLERATDAIHEAGFRIAAQGLDFWGAGLRYMMDRLDMASDRPRAESLIAAGIKAYENEDKPRLQQIVQELVSLMPPEAQPPAPGSAAGFPASGVRA